MTLATTLGRLRIVGLLEGISFLLLLGIAMPLKYLAGQPAAVQVVGMAHGILFLLYVLGAVLAHVEYAWPVKRTALVVLASVVPLGPFIAESRLLRPLAEANGGA